MGASWTCEVCGTDVLGSVCPNAGDFAHREYEIARLRAEVERLERRSAAEGETTAQLAAHLQDARAENARLRERLRPPEACKGCPGCSSDDCPDALDYALSEVERLREAAKLATDCFEEIRDYCSDYTEAVLECRRGIAALKPADGEGGEVGDE